MRLPQDKILHIDAGVEDGQVIIKSEWRGELVRCVDCEYIGTCCRNIFTDPISHEITLTYCSAGKRKDGDNNEID